MARGKGQKPTSRQEPVPDDSLLFTGKVLRRARIIFTLEKSVDIIIKMIAHRKLSNKTILVCLITCLIGCSVPLTKPFIGIQNAENSEYGYVPEKAIRMGHYRDFRKAIDASYYFMSCLYTIDGKPLRIVGRVSIDDPIHDASWPNPLGLPMRGRLPVGGILDKYSLVVDGTSDTLNLYFDVYHKDKIQVPAGLKFIERPINNKESAQ